MKKKWPTKALNSQIRKREKKKNKEREEGEFKYSRQGKEMERGMCK